MRVYYSPYLPLGIGPIPANRVVCVVVRIIWIFIGGLSMYMTVRLISWFAMFAGWALVLFGEAIGWGIVLIIVGTGLNIYSRFKENNEENNR